MSLPSLQSFGSSDAVPFSEALRVWTRVAVQSFGAAAGLAWHLLAR